MPLARRSKWMKRRSTSARRSDPLDELCRRVVMVRAGAYEVEIEGKTRWYGKCQRCALFKFLVWCHYFSRGIKRTCWDTRNGWAFCDGCHYIVDEVEPRQRIGDTWFSEFVIAMVGLEEHADLCAQARGKDAEGRPVAVVRRSAHEIKVGLEFELATMMNGGSRG